MKTKGNQTSKNANLKTTKFNNKNVFFSREEKTVDEKVEEALVSVADEKGSDFDSELDDANEEGEEADSNDDDDNKGIFHIRCKFLFN